MKTQKTDSKLGLKKETIARLSDREMRNMYGGTGTNSDLCPTWAYCVPNPTLWW